MWEKIFFPSIMVIKLRAIYTEMFPLFNTPFIFLIYLSIFLSSSCKKWCSLVLAIFYWGLRLRNHCLMININTVFFWRAYLRTAWRQYFTQGGRSSDGEKVSVWAWGLVGWSALDGPHSQTVEGWGIAFTPRTVAWQMLAWASKAAWQAHAESKVALMCSGMRLANHTFTYAMTYICMSACTLSGLINDGHLPALRRPAERRERARGWRLFWQPKGRAASQD